MSYIIDGMGPETDHIEADPWHAGSIPADPAEIAQLLDDHHLVVIGEDAAARADFAAALREHLEAIPDAEVISLDGTKIADLESLCVRLERRLNDGTPVKHTIGGVIRLLRGSAHEPKHLYLVWDNADVLLETDVRLFGRVANALMGTAAEREHVTPDVLVLQRIVFLGGDKLGAYAEEERGQFHEWLLDHGSSPFWEAICCVSRPPVLVYRLDG